MDKPTRDEINKLAFRNPIVSKALKHYLCGNLTYEEALITMVLALAGQTDEMKDMITEAIQRHVEQYDHTDLQEAHDYQ